MSLRATTPAFLAGRIAKAAAFAVVGDFRLQVVAFRWVVVLQPASTETAMAARKTFLEAINMGRSP